MVGDMVVPYLCPSLDGNAAAGNCLRSDQVELVGEGMLHQLVMADASRVYGYYIEKKDFIFIISFNQSINLYALRDKYHLIQRKTLAWLFLIKTKIIRKILQKLEIYNKLNRQKRETCGKLSMCIF